MDSAIRTLSTFAFGLLVLLLGDIAIGSGNLRTAALTGDAPPGIEAGVLFSGLGFLGNAPVLNDNGNVAFTGLLAGTGSFSNDTGVWSEGSGNGLALIARDGDTAPETSVPFSDFRSTRLVMNNNGHVAFYTSLNTSQPGVNSTNFAGVWSEGQGSGLALVIRAGDAAPGTNTTFRADTFSNPALNNSGQTAFENFLEQPGIPNFNSTSIWSEGGGNGIELIARAGNDAPGTPKGTKFGSVGSSNINPRLNDNGQMVFHASLRLPGAVNDLTNEESVWKGGANNLALVARAGDVAPGIGLDARFRFFSRNEGLAINSQGQTAFRASLDLSTPGINNDNNGGIWSEGGGNGLGLIASEGDYAPGTPQGVFFNFSTVPDNLVLNNNGHTAFLGFLQGAESGSGIWSEGRGNGLELVARSGIPAPETEPGVDFDRFFEQTIVLNNRGQTAFFANMTGPGIDSINNDTGIWAEDLTGNLRLIAREGRQIDVSDDPLAPDLRTIDFLFPMAGSTGNGDGRASAFNDRGQLVFAARFTDGSEGVFVSHLVAVPEPHSLLLLGLLTITRIVSRRSLCQC